MAKLLSSWCKDIKSVPDKYILPPEKRAQPDIPISKEIPVLDLSLAAMGTEEDRPKLAAQIIKALEEFTGFQVINHGIPEKVMEGSMEVCKEFFNLPAEEKEEYVSDEISYGKAWLYTGTVKYDAEKNQNWVDGLGHLCYPVEETINSWPNKPPRYREVIAEYAVGSKKLSQMILELIAQGLGLEKGYFAGKLSDGHTLVVNHYPKCPDPSLTIGLKEHHDPTVLTTIQQNVCGLHLFVNGKWLAVDPLPNAIFVINGYQLEVISNGRLKSALHRVVTNAEADRTTISYFINPGDGESVIEPAKAVLSDGNPPKFRAFTYSEFIKKKMEVDGESALAAFRL